MHQEMTRDDILDQLAQCDRRIQGLDIQLAEHHTQRRNLLRAFLRFAPDDARSRINKEVARSF